MMKALILTLSLIALSKSAARDGQVEYGVDVSFPIHHATISTNYPWLPHNVGAFGEVPTEHKDKPLQVLGDRKSLYQNHMLGCIEASSDDDDDDSGVDCIRSEQIRIDMARNQPPAMFNYTKLGYQKMRAPAPLYDMLKEFWDRNRQYPVQEQWKQAVSNSNNWAVPSDMVSVENLQLRGGGRTFCLKAWDAAKDVISEWTNQELAYSSLYGVRVYKEGAILAPHVDRLPLVLSAIINVDSDLYEPWPLEVYGHDGKAANITMEPGDMVLYESHTVIHGRPFPLKGRFVANVFIHFEPIGPVGTTTDIVETIEQRIGLPPYIVPGSYAAEEWLENHPDGRRPPVTNFIEGSSYAHFAAREGSVVQLSMEIKKDKTVVHSTDRDGFTPLHIAAKAGHADIAKLLLENGANVDLKSANEFDATALVLAQAVHDNDHAVVRYLQEVGATNVGADL